jgi:ribosomal protein L11
MKAKASVPVWVGITNRAANDIRWCINVPPTAKYEAQALQTDEGEAEPAQEDNAIFAILSAEEIFALWPGYVNHVTAGQQQLA